MVLPRALDRRGETPWKAPALGLPSPPTRGPGGPEGVGSYRLTSQPPATGGGRLCARAGGGAFRRLGGGPAPAPEPSSRTEFPRSARSPRPSPPRTGCSRGGCQARPPQVPASLPGRVRRPRGAIRQLWLQGCLVRGVPAGSSGPGIGGPGGGAAGTGNDPKPHPAQGRWPSGLKPGAPPNWFGNFPGFNTEHPRRPRAITGHLRSGQTLPGPEWGAGAGEGLRVSRGLPRPLSGAPSSGPRTAHRPAGVGKPQENQTLEEQTPPPDLVPAVRAPPPTLCPPPLGPVGTL